MNSTVSWRLLTVCSMIQWFTNLYQAFGDQDSTECFSWRRHLRTQTLYFTCPKLTGVC